MCILFLAVNQHADYPLIVAANRDEMHARPSQSLHCWTDGSGIIAGKDLQAGGTWLGVSKTGRFAALTNIRRPDLLKTTARSRGELVTGLLSSAEPHEFIESLSTNDDYNPFNLIFSDQNKVFVYCSTQKECNELADGFHAICNGEPAEHWPKMQRGVQLVTAAVEAGQLDPQKMFQIMGDTQLADDASLPDTGVGYDAEKLLSPIFIINSEYGTRTTSLLFLRPSSYQFLEQNYLADASVVSMHELQGVFVR